MARKRVLRVLFVRPAAVQRLPTLYGVPGPIDPAEVLPVALLRLATAVKLGSPHRVFVHDGRRAPAGNRGTRGVAAVHRADVAVIELDLAALADGLEAARAARDGGASLVFATGSLVASWPDPVAEMLEFDGVVHPGGAPSLLGLLARAAVDELDAQSLADALALPPAPAPDDARGSDRRLLDYAVYRSPHRSIPAPVGRRVDKGRWAASPVLLTDEAGELRDQGEVRDDLRECALLGIPHIALMPGSVRPTQRWIEDLLGRNPGTRIIAPAPSGRPASLEGLAGHGVWALDLGAVPVGDPDVLAWAGTWAKAAKDAGLQLLGRACFGLHALDAEERGLAAVRSWAQPLDVLLVCAIPPTEPAAQRALAGFLDAPRAGFRPPVRGGDRTVELAERARLLLAVPAQTGPRAAAGRLFRWARGG